MPTVKLTPSQKTFLLLCVDKGGERAIGTYAPALKLKELGLLTEEPARYGNSLWVPTDAGRAEAARLGFVAQEGA